ASLESVFVHLRSVMPKRTWQELGRGFCYKEAFKEEQLGFLPVAFFEFLIKQTMTGTERWNLQKDMALFHCQQARLAEILTVEDLNLLNEDSVLRLQDTVQILQQQGKAWVLSRNRQRFFAQTVSGQTAGVLAQLKQKNTAVP